MLQTDLEDIMMFRLMSQTDDIDTFHRTADEIAVSINGACMIIPVIHDRHDIPYIISKQLVIETVECNCRTPRGTHTWWEPELKSKYVYLDVSFLRYIPITINGTSIICSPSSTYHDIYWEAELYKCNTYKYKDIDFMIYTYNVEIV